MFNATFAGDRSLRVSDARAIDIRAAFGFPEKLSKTSSISSARFRERRARPSVCSILAINCDIALNCQKSVQPSWPPWKIRQRDGAQTVSRTAIRLFSFFGFEQERVNRWRKPPQVAPSAASPFSAAQRSILPAKRPGTEGP